MRLSKRREEMFLCLISLLKDQWGGRAVSVRGHEGVIHNCLWFLLTSLFLDVLLEYLSFFLFCYHSVAFSSFATLAVMFIM